MPPTSDVSAHPELSNVRRTVMNRRLLMFGLTVAAFGVALGIHSVAAHHSTTMFDHSKSLTITGTVVEVHWVNPHVSILINGAVKDGDQPSDWLMEMTSPGNLVRAGGWSRTAVKPGDKVIVEFSPLRDPDRQGGALKKLTLVDSGVVLTANIRAQEMPGLE
jgi:uncharacterized protein DUF6152